ncbi:transcriptional adapter 2-alpha [Thraustotheca clavata]|uniref:Transcriptional adapter n=1 Tax=Thraustotheca clavata TaxID=74557 RepID=A0A1W0A0X6_9STRA|nr:transcriptional adapter 2-alpha [Thraustotheca clavata]
MGESKDKVSCQYCTRDLTRLIRITCAECKPEKGPLVLCIECFSVGVEEIPCAPEHRKDHSYRVSDCLAYSIYEPEWTVDEELLLLEGIEMFGMGNWKDIADHVASKTDKKCEAHYMTEYLKLDPTPDDSPVKSKTNSSSTSSLPTEEDKEKMGGALAGYLPLRGDFDVEHDNDAELILADMEFHDDDHPTERELKLKVISIYNAKLDERERRKKFVIEHGLLDYKKYQQVERRRPKEEREIIAQVRPFARFHSKEDHDTFVSGLIAAMRLRKQIAQLQEYRMHGIRTLAEAEMFELDKKKKETEQALQKSRESAAYLYDSARNASGNRVRNSRWLNREQDGEKTNASGIIDGAPGAHLLTPKEKELCARLQLLPKQYLVIKDVLVRESYRLGHLDVNTATNMVHIDATKTGQIYDFFVHAGWVKKDGKSSLTKIRPPAPEESPSKKQKIIP